MTKLADRVLNHVRSGDYGLAIRLAKSECALPGKDEALLAALRELTANLRSQCMDMAVRKADAGQVYLSIESLLREANELTGEDMYGRLR